MYQSRHIRACLAESLVYPRLLAIARIDVRKCPHGGSFDTSDDRCWQCTKEIECRWLDTFNRYEDTSGMAANELIVALDMAAEFVAQHNAHHERCVCDCRTCSWLRDTRHLVKHYKREPARKL